MFNVALLADIATIENQTLLKRGDVFTEDVLDSIISSGKGRTYPMYPLLHHESIQQDLVFCISQDPYREIFSIGDKFSGLLQCMQNVYLAAPVLQTLAALRSYDPYTYRHTLVVFALSTLLSTFTIEEFQDRVKEATSSPSHDLGKICTPVHILQKRGPLTRNELAVLDQHTVAGNVLLSYYYRDTGNLSAIVARDHHETKNGTGQPGGIYLNNPLVEIVVVCDIYDALISSRPYRPVSYDNRTALEVLTAMAFNNEVNIDVVRALVALNRKEKPDYRECSLSVQERGSPPRDNNYGKIDEDDDTPSETGKD